MRTFDVQAVEIPAPFEVAFDYIADPAMLPEWTHAFASVKGRKATMRTAAGTAAVELIVTTSREAGTIDWTILFPDGLAARAFSRVVPHGSDGVIYSFVPEASPVPLEQLEGTIDRQSKELTDELATLVHVLERRASSLEGRRFDRDPPVPRRLGRGLRALASGMRWMSC
jgi:hypothetical protein